MVKLSSCQGFEPRYAGRRSRWWDLIAKLPEAPRTGPALSQDTIQARLNCGIPRHLAKATNRQLAQISGLPMGTIQASVHRGNHISPRTPWPEAGSQSTAQDQVNALVVHLWHRQQLPLHAIFLLRIAP